MSSQPGSERAAHLRYSFAVLFVELNISKNTEQNVGFLRLLEDRRTDSVIWAASFFI
jgi:hypothetical protein